ncbi:helix-turn-helix transcriptional regulator [Maricaulis maris]|uniref:Helix-turn-helix protein n=1 Tax=Maricaulis maris TaxID=74318 RepID=A0A495DL19_9PROT|nr:helix-turn-helix transcriptional regulator [Maricaulis maris]RKR03605.1 helix-turn-helix protein [Maricaulis maris]
MSIGSRLKDERGRLGMSQEAFARAAGVSKRTLIEWEKGATFPSAAALQSLGEVGADVLFVVTGSRQGASTGIAESEALAAVVTAEAELEASRELVPELAATIVSVSRDDNIDDKLRARADLVIRFAFRGTEAAKEAEARQRERNQRHQGELAWANMIVSNACEAIQWAPPQQVLSHLVNLVRIYKIDPEYIAVLLADLASTSKMPDRD